MLRLTTALLCLLVVSVVVCGTEPAQPSESSMHVECHGQLRHGVVAIGSETTGTTIRFNGIVWELKLNDDDTRAWAEAHHKQPVPVTASLRRVAGVEVPVRWIVDVKRLVERDASKHQEKTNVTVLGTLKAKEKTSNSVGTTVIEADGISWPLDLRADTVLQAKAESLVHKPAVLKGQIESHSKTDPLSKMIFRVSDLDAAPASASK